MKKLLLIATAVALCFAANAQSFEKKTFKSASGAELLYNQLDPVFAAKGGKYPLVLFLHGAGERGSDNCAQLTHGSGLFLNPYNAKNFPAYVVFPQCPEGTTWAYDARLKPDWSTLPQDLPTDNPESGMVSLLIEFIRDFIAAHPDVNTKRIYIMGLSMGAIATFEIVSRYPDIFAAAVPMCGSVNPAKLIAAKDVKFSIYHGEKDSVVPVSGSREAVKALQAAGASVRYKEFAGCDHGCWNPAFNEPDFLPWLFKQHK